MKEVKAVMFGKREDWYVFDVSENGVLVGKYQETAIGGFETEYCSHYDS